MSSMVGQFGGMVGQVGSMFGQVTQVGGQLPQMLGQAPQMFSGMLGPLSSMNGATAAAAGAGADAAAHRWRAWAAWGPSQAPVAVVAAAGGRIIGAVKHFRATGKQFQLTHRADAARRLAGRRSAGGVWRLGPPAVGGGGLYGAPPA